MRDDSPFLKGFFATGDSFEQSQLFPHLGEGVNIDEISGRDAVLGDENRFPIFRKAFNKIGGLPLQGGDELGSHKSDTKVTLCMRQMSSVTRKMKFRKIPFVPVNGYNASIPGL